jgi:hypothetical protein
MRDLPQLFTTDKVTMMEDEELKSLASEAPETEAERAELQGQCDALRQGLQLISRYRDRSAEREFHTRSHFPRGVHAEHNNSHCHTKRLS